MGYQAMVKWREARDAPASGPYDFPSAEARKAFVTGDNGVYWYHLAEDDDWHSWKRGGAWAATAQPGPADREHTPPEITEGDRWLESA